MGETAEQRRWLAWMEDALGPGLRFDGARALAGATSSEVLLTSWRTAAGEEHYVLRRFTNTEWLASEPHLARQESLALRAAAAGETAVPRLIAADESGEAAGTPAVLMSYLPGGIVLKPDDMDAWTGELARALASVHRIEDASTPFRYFKYYPAEKAAVPAWSAIPDIWAQIVERVRGEAPAYRETFIHRDYHPVNVLWRDGRISGIVDWVNGCMGPPGVDLGHCRVNLALLHGVESADRFLDAYLAANPAYRYDPYWDMISLTDMDDGPPSVYAGWTAYGVSGLTDALMAQRLDRYASSLVDRLAAGG